MDALTREQFDQTWWKTPPPPDPDNEVICRRRLREALADEATHDVSEWRGEVS